MGTAAAAVLAAAVLAACQPAPQQGFAVTSTADEPDAVPGDGTCASAPSGACTLRAAVQEANAAPAGTHTTITLAPAAEYVLTRTGAEDVGLTGDLDVHADVTILGSGSTIAGTLDLLGPDPFGFRLFEHHAGTLELQGLTLFAARAGSHPDLSFPTDGTVGGGVLNHAILRMVDVVASSTYASRGGSAVHQTGGSTHLVRVAFTGQPLTQSGTGAPANAVVYVEAGGLVVVDSSIAANPSSPDTFSTATYAAIHQASGNAVLASSTIADNVASTFVCDPFFCGILTEGADGVVAHGTMTILRSTIVGNALHAQFDPDRTDLAGSGDVTLAGSVVGACTLGATSGGHNVVGAAGCLASAAPTDAVAPWAGALGPLGDHGGPTPTRVPVAAGALVDAIPPGTAGLCDGSFTTDQRGHPQAVGAGCDVGAVERQPGDA